MHNLINFPLNLENDCLNECMTNNYMTNNVTNTDI